MISLHIVSAVFPYLFWCRFIATHKITIFCCYDVYLVVTAQASSSVELTTRLTIYT